MQYIGNVTCVSKMRLPTKLIHELHFRCRNKNDGLFGSSTVKAADAVRVLGGLFTLEKHETTVSAKCFFKFQLRRVRRSLDRESTATLVHTFVTSRIDYGKAPLATDKLRRVLNAAARVITGIQKFDRCLRHILHD